MMKTLVVARVSERWDNPTSIYSNPAETLRRAHALATWPVEFVLIPVNLWRLAVCHPAMSGYLGRPVPPLHVLEDAMGFERGTIRIGDTGQEVVVGDVVVSGLAEDEA